MNNLKQGEWIKYDDTKPYEVLDNIVPNDYDRPHKVEVWSDEADRYVTEIRPHGSCHYLTPQFLIYYKGRLFIDYMRKMTGSDHWIFAAEEGLEELDCSGHILWMPIPDTYNDDKLFFKVLDKNVNC